MALAGHEGVTVRQSLAVSPGLVGLEAHRPFLTAVDEEQEPPQLPCPPHLVGGRAKVVSPTTQVLPADPPVIK